MKMKSLRGIIQKESEGYYTSNYDYTVCNNTDGVTEKNLGFVKGIIAGGVPFEAELFEKDENLTMAVIIPTIYNYACKDKENDELSDKNTNIIVMHYEAESADYSVLDIGMVDDAMEESTDVVRNYVDFLANNDIVTFAFNLLNGAVLYSRDVLGNELAKVLITLREGEDLWAYTNLNFTEFPKKYKRYDRQKFKVIQREEK